MKEILALILIIVMFAIVSTMDYSNAVRQEHYQLTAQELRNVLR